VEAELEKASLHAGFVHSMSGILQLCATLVTCKEIIDIGLGENSAVPRMWVFALKVSPSGEHEKHIGAIGTAILSSHGVREA
jgi:hypothetical protein